ncbi:MAG: RNB domain-containing ribonuclease [Pseudomonadota bacterium]
MNASGQSGSEDLRSIARRVMFDRGLLPDFSAAALKQTDLITAAASTTGSDIRDLRALLWASIDNDDSRDLDQLTVAEQLPDGVARILIAIADVDALVGRGSPIDEHARSNTTSVYTAAQIFPMLPEKLSTDLSSLGEGQTRLALVIEMKVGRDGAVSDQQVYRAAVFNHAKLTYSSVGAWLENKAPPPSQFAVVAGLEQQLRLQDQVAQALKSVRHAHGALTLETIEARAVYDAGVLTDLRPAAKNRAMELIEDFMIAANVVTARFLDARKLPSLRRVLRSPERWERIVALAASFGEHLPATADVAALNAFLMKRREADPARFPDISLSVIKMLGSGEYVLELPGQRAAGHFGLAVNDYTHSTAPNRRFPDLITQRLLKSALTGSPSPYTDSQLQELAAHCTQQEDMATKVERQVTKSAAALLLGSHIGERFDAVVTGASAKGTWVRISRPTAEGRMIRGSAGLDVGDTVRVQLVHTDAARGFIDFARAH